MPGNRNWRHALEKFKGRRDQCQSALTNAQQQVSDLSLQVIYCEEACVIIQNVAQLTQEQLTYRISELVSLALAAVFDDPYEFRVEFVLRRNRTEADLWFRRNGKKIHPLSASGGGAVDVASFALRVALWSLMQPRSRNTFILDEPLHFLKGDELPEKGALMMAEISKKVQLQILMVSHIPDQIEGADKVIAVSRKSGVSRVN